MSILSSFPIYPTENVFPFFYFSRFVHTDVFHIFLIIFSLQIIFSIFLSFTQKMHSTFQNFASENVDNDVFQSYNFFPDNFPKFAYSRLVSESRSHKYEMMRLLSDQF